MISVIIYNFGLRFGCVIGFQKMLISQIMKHVFFFITFLLIYTGGYSQNDSISNEKIVYCQLVGTSFLGKVTVSIDMGEKTGFMRLNTSYLIDERTGKAMKFNSMVDALNFMGEQGWELAQAYALGEGGSYVYHYLLKQKVLKGDDGSYYPATKKVFSKSDPKNEIKDEEIY